MLSLFHIIALRKDAPFICCLVSLWVLKLSQPSLRQPGQVSGSSVGQTEKINSA